MASRFLLVAKHVYGDLMVTLVTPPQLLARAIILLGCLKTGLEGVRTLTANGFCSWPNSMQGELLDRTACWLPSVLHHTFSRDRMGLEGIY
jgi:hypothetical protein